MNHGTRRTASCNRGLSAHDHDPSLERRAGFEPAEQGFAGPCIYHSATDASAPRRERDDLFGCQSSKCLESPKTSDWGDRRELNPRFPASQAGAAKPTAASATARWTGFEPASPGIGTPACSHYTTFSVLRREPDFAFATARSCGSTGTRTLHLLLAKQAL